MVGNERSPPDRGGVRGGGRVIRLVARRRTRCISEVACAEEGKHA
jgi:hypothetical protein